MSPYLRLRVIVVADIEGELLTLPAPRLRRMLGKALIDQFCPYGKPLCEGETTVREGSAAAPASLCSQASSCPYGVLFAASLTSRPPFALYVEPALETNAAIPIEITLYGPAVRFLPWLGMALGRALREGAGRDRVRARMAAVGRVRPVGVVEAFRSADPADWPARVVPDLVHGGVQALTTFRFVTVLMRSPTRLLRDGRLVREPEDVSLDLLLARILGRYADLYGVGSNELLEPDTRAALLAEASALAPLDWDATWLEVRDYSARKGQEIRLGGLVGRLLYPTAAARFAPLLKMGEILHVGKNTASGCGRIEVRVDDGA